MFGLLNPQSLRKGKRKRVAASGWAVRGEPETERRSHRKEEKTGRSEASIRQLRNVKRVSIHPVRKTGRENTVVPHLGGEIS